MLLIGLFAASLPTGLLSPKIASAQDAKKTHQADDQAAPQENPFPGRFPAPSLDGGTEWINTSGPIDLRELRGKIVLLDFWTYCCINCMHVLPDLKYLEQKYGRQLVVIGVHSAKFDNEKQTENIRDAILRYEIEHPVVNDSEMLIWRKFGTRAWPTLALVDPEGRYIGSQSGEGNRELFDQVIGKLVEYHRWKGTLDENPILFSQESEKTTATPLRYPGKVLADAESGRVFIADTSHNRIVVCDMNGQLLDLVGCGNIGTQDGAFEQAEFDHPQGMALVGDLLYVADTENHLLRVVDLPARRVRTLAGTGRQGRTGRDTGGPLLTTSLNSPWSLAHSNGTLFIAMAGPHQIWSHHIGDDHIAVFAGSGREDVINGALTEAAFAQPSELTIDDSGKFLYVADSEGSAVRRLNTSPNGTVTTVAGTSELPAGQSLFAFGDVDGTAQAARFQHPLGVVFAAGRLYVADSYNHKIKVIDEETGLTTTWLGDGVAGTELQPARFSEPGGLAVAAGKL
ncbi:MAG: redoxin domain-containing protein, partial [Planctomycetaceae bacterium]|nr:redoxin domain-containing protein [Planctomycetaceae bacterium]